MNLKEVASQKVTRGTNGAPSRNFINVYAGAAFGDNHPIRIRGQARPVGDVTGGMKI